MSRWKIRIQWQPRDITVGVAWRRCPDHEGALDIWVCLVPCLPIHIWREPDFKPCVAPSCPPLEEYTVSGSWGHWSVPGVVMPRIVTDGDIGDIGDIGERPTDEERIARIRLSLKLLQAEQNSGIVQRGVLYIPPEIRATDPTDWYGQL